MTIGRNPFSCKDRKVRVIVYRCQWIFARGTIPRPNSTGEKIAIDEGSNNRKFSKGVVDEEVKCLGAQCTIRKTMEKLKIHFKTIIFAYFVEIDYFRKKVFVTLEVIGA